MGAYRSSAVGESTANAAPWIGKISPVVTEDLQVIVDRLAERLRRSVVIDDPEVRLLYASAHFGDEDPVRVRAILHRNAGSKVIGYVLAQGVTTWTAAGVIPANEQLGMKARVCAPISWRGRLLGLLMVIDADGSLTSTELRAITETAQDAAAIMAARERKDEHAAAREQMVLDLISREPVVRRRALADLGSDGELGQFEFVTAVELGPRHVPEGTISPHVEASLRSALTIRYPHDAVAKLHAASGATGLVLLGSGRPMRSDVVRSHAGRMLTQVNDMSAGRFASAAGVGSCVRGLDRAVDTARQARLARRAAASVLDLTVAAWADLGPYGPLLQIPAADLCESVIPDELHRLLDVDQDRHLVATLRAFLDSGCSGPAAAEALHIHRTTLYYRLNRVASLTGLDLADGRNRLVLHLGLTMLDLIDSRPRQ